MARIDPKGEKWALLQALLRKALAGTLEIIPHASAWLSKIVNGGNVKLRIRGVDIKRDLASGYIWIGEFSHSPCYV